MAWRTEVIADSSGTWAGNAVVLATREEAESYVTDLKWRWLAVRETRTLETDAEVNYTFAEGTLTRLEEVTR